ncbi:MAG: HAD family hydrolase [Capnocytophaga sp.]|nr:HAD family hydrolase [Capnocytophaga sp.]
MNCKIVFSDVDGTLLNSERSLSQETINQVNKLKGKVPFILVSSRMPKQMWYLQELLGTEQEPVVAYNGALVLGKKVWHSTEIPISVVEKVISSNEKLLDGKVHISMYHNDLWYAPTYDIWAKREENNTCTTPEIRSNREVLSDWKTKNIGAHKLMLMGEVEYVDKMFDFLTTNLSNELHIYRGKDTYIEVADSKVSKLTGIDVLLKEKYHFTREEAMAFGDNYNDMDMIANVGYGIAVANAREELKQVAKEITLHHKEDGVAHYLNNFFK